MKRYISQHIVRSARQKTIYYTQLKREEPSVKEVLLDLRSNQQEKEENKDEEEQILL